MADATNNATGDPKWTFHPAWSVNLSVPLYCLTIFGLLNFKNETIFNRFSAVGTITTRDILYVIIPRAAYATAWGII